VFPVFPVEIFFRWFSAGSAHARDDFTRTFPEADTHASGRFGIGRHHQSIAFLQESALLAAG
jgi:hypothetical protein